MNERGFHTLRSVESSLYNVPMPSWIQVRIAPPDGPSDASGLFRLNLDPFTLEEQVRVLRMLGRHEVLEVFDATGHPIYPTDEQVNSLEGWSAFFDLAFHLYLERRNQARGKQFDQQREIEMRKATFKPLLDLPGHVLFEQADSLSEVLQRDYRDLDAEVEQQARVLRRRIRRELLGHLRARDLENRQWVEQHGSAALKETLLLLPRKKFFVDPEAELEVGASWVKDELLWESHEYDQYVKERIGQEHPQGLFCKDLDATFQVLASPPPELLECLSRVGGKAVVFEDFPVYGFDKEALASFEEIHRSGPMLAVHLKHSLGHVIYPFAGL